MYDASTDVEKWPIFLENVAEFFASKGAQIAHYDRGRNHHNFNFIHGFEFDRETLESIEHLIPDDPRFQYGLANAPKPIHCRMAVTTEELHATEIYKQLLGPAGIEYSAAVMLPLDDGLMTFSHCFGPPRIRFSPTRIARCSANSCPSQARYWHLQKTIRQPCARSNCTRSVRQCAHRNRCRRSRRRHPLRQRSCAQSGRYKWNSCRWRAHRSWISVAERRTSRSHQRLHHANGELVSSYIRRGDDHRR